MTEALEQAAIDQALKALPGWKGAPNGLSRTYRFGTFAKAIDYMRECASGIDRLDHHPEWTNVYDRVSIVLKTHDAGDRVTAKDVELAKHLEAMAKAKGGK